MGGVAGVWCVEVLNGGISGVRCARVEVSQSLVLFFSVCMFMCMWISGDKGVCVEEKKKEGCRVE